MMFINLSNHPSTLWSQEQLQAANHFGACIDIPFPIVAPDADKDQIATLAIEYFNKIKEVSNDNKEITVHLMGEMTFVYSLLQLLQEAGIRTVASTTERQTKDLGDGQKESQFRFVQFRDYY